MFGRLQYLELSNERVVWEIFGIGSDKAKGKFHTIPYHTIPHHTSPYHTTPYQSACFGNSKAGEYVLVGMQGQRGVKQHQWGLLCTLQILGRHSDTEMGHNRKKD